MKLSLLSSPEEKQKKLKNFSGKGFSWVVSDLRNKLEIQKKLLNKSSFLEDKAVLRASELWKKLLFQICPQLQVLSKDMAESVISAELRAQGHKGQTLKMAKLILVYMEYLMPFLIHPEGAEVLDEYFQREPSASVRWGQWHQRARLHWKSFLDQNLIPEPLVSGVLLGELQAGSVPTWDRGFVFDLSSEISAVEADIISELSKVQSVEVLIPNPRGRATLEEALEDESLWGYCVWSKELKAESKSKTTLGSLPLDTPTGFQYYATQLSEVKAATAKVRQWLEQGVPAERIGIIAPRSSEYWSALSPYLKAEGIPVQRPVTRSYLGHAFVQKWISQMRLQMGGLSSQDVETVLFSPEWKAMAFERFQRYFSILSNSQEFLNRKQMKEIFHSKVFQKDQMITSEEFIEWSAGCLPKNVNLGVFESVVSCLQIPLSLHASEWLDALEAICIHSEFPVELGSQSGIFCEDIHSADSLDLDCIFVLGLSEEALSEDLGVMISKKEVQMFAEQMGFYTIFPERKNLEFELRWLLSKKHKEVICSVPEMDFEGEVKTISTFWLKEAMVRKTGDEDVRTLSSCSEISPRWDQIQKQNVEDYCKFRGWEKSRSQGFVSAIHADKGWKEKPPFVVSLERVSASTLTNYLKCPFITSADKVLGLRDEELLSWDEGPRERGSFLHHVLEKLVTEPLNFPLDDSVLEQQLEESYQKHSFVKAEVWPLYKERYKEVITGILEKEAQDRKMFPKLKTVAKEVAFQAHWSFKKGQLVKEGGELAFKGIIDRVDEVCGSYIITDYKSSLGSLTHHGSWLNNNHLQLPLYAQALEAGALEGLLGPVFKAKYQTLKFPFDDEKGFVNEEALPEGDKNWIANSKRGIKIQEAKKMELYQKVNEKVQGAVESILKGQWGPKPEKEKHCDKCVWRTVCRYSKLI